MYSVILIVSPIKCNYFVIIYYISRIILKGNGVIIRSNEKKGQIKISSQNVT